MVARIGHTASLGGTMSRFLALSVGALLLVSPAFAQGTITDGAVSFTINTFGTPTTANFLGGTSSGDALFAEWWYYRVDGDTEETAFPSPDAESYVGNVATLNWNDVDGRGFSAELVITLADLGGPSGTINFVMTLTNLGGTPLTVDVFNYADLDKVGFNNDFADLIGSGAIQVTDGTASDFCEYFAVGASAFEVAPFANIVSSLNDGAITNLANAGLPFVAQDFTGAFQWASQSLPAMGSLTFEAVITANADAASASSGGGATVPTLGEWGVIFCVLALAALGALRFKKLQLA